MLEGALGGDRGDETDLPVPRFYCTIFTLNCGFVKVEESSFHVSQG
jgi:hypothetical protein